MILELQDLKIDFTTAAGMLHAVRGVSFSVSEGEVLGIVGESGSGKSVTAHSILRLLPGNGEVVSGDIRYNNSSVLSLGKEQLRRFRGQEVGIVFQEPGRSFDPIYSIGKAMSETLRAHNPGISDEEARLRSIQLLEEAKVPQAAERLGNFPHQFSGGLLQRVMIALALASDPKILIADEPTTALDVTIQAQIIDLLLELKQRRGLAIVFITHNLALISSIADRIVVMYSGLVLEQGPARQVLHTPRHPYTRALLSSILSMGDHHSSRSVAIIRGGVPDPTQPEPGCPFAPRCPLAAPDCRTAVPALSAEAGVDHRCIFPGEKGEDLYARS